MGRETEAGHYEYQDWLANETAARAVGDLGRELERGFGSQRDQDTSNVWLARGLIGVASDHAAKEYVVVVDPSLVDRPELQRRLEAVVTRAFGPGKTGFGVRVIAACFSARDLAAARRTIDQRRWHAKAGTATYAFRLDAYDSTYHATFRPEDGEAAEALKAQLGDLVTISFDDIGYVGRLDDGEPHWGGAGIRGSGVSYNHCTSAFTVRLSNGTRGAVTAAHCFKLTGSGVISGRSVYSGPQYYGVSSGGSSFPYYDMVRIHPNGERFDRKIHVDPCCPSVRTVVSVGNPTLNSFVCASGMVTRARCGAQVLDLNESFCSVFGCTPNLVYARKPGYLIAQGGDSGAPVYQRYGDTGAAARGMLTVARRGGGDYFLFHKIGTIHSHLGVTVVTS